MISRIRNYYKNNGFKDTIKKFISKFFVFLGLVEDISQTRIRLSNYIYDKCDGEVKYGPMKGLSLSINNMQWSKYDLGSILLGFYELEVLTELEFLSSKYRIFCDIGAADGIFGVGLVASNLYEQSICFEIDKIGRKNIKALAKANNVEKEIKVFGEASAESMRSLNLDWKQVCILIDIEGDEFNFINQDFIKTVNGAALVIEIHDQYKPNPSSAKQELMSLLNKSYNIKTITTSSRDLSNIEELRYMHDNERWLLCSEGRGWRMDWWVCEPK